MDEKQFERIQDYLNGSMSSEEKLLFETELASDKELSWRFKLYQAIEEEMRGNETGSSDETSLRSSLEALTKKHFRTKPQKEEEQGGTLHSAASNTTTEIPSKGKPEVFMTGKRQNNVVISGIWKKLAVAAVLLGVVVWGAIRYVQTSGKNADVAVTGKKTNAPEKIIEPDSTSPLLNTSPNDVFTSDKNEKTQELNNESTTGRVTPRPVDKESSNDLFSAYFKPDALPQPNLNAPDFDANESYQKGEYKEAITSFKEVIERTESPESRTRGSEDEINQYLFYAYYYKAQSYAAIDSVAKAIADLRKALQRSPDNYWKSKVQWYLALAYLKHERVKEAEALLNQVANNSKAGEYRRKANQLRSELMNIKK